MSKANAKRQSAEALMHGGYFAMGMAVKCAFAVPFLTATEAIFCGETADWQLWCYIAALALSVALGTLWTRAVAKRAAKAGARKIPAGFLRVFGYVVVAAGLACACCIPRGFSAAAIFAFAVTLTVFICCMASARLGYGDMLSVSGLAGLGVLYAAFIAFEAILHKFFDITFNRSPMIICLIICCACAAVILNQSNLESLASRRRKVSLPMRVRVNNLKLVLITLAILLVGYIFRSQIVWAAQTALYALWRCIFYIIRGFFAFIAWLGSLGADDELVGDMGGAANDMGLPEAEESGFDGTWIAILFFAAVIIFFAVKFGPRLLSFISAQIKKLLGWIAELFGRAARPDDSGNDLFSDSEEALEAQEERREERRSSRAQRRMMKTALRRYEGLSGVERVREGYRLMLGALVCRGTPADAACTPRELPEKIDDGYISERFENAAPIYDAARYGGMEPESGAPEFDAAVRETCAAAISKRR